MNDSSSIPFGEFSRLCFTMGQAVLKESKKQSTEIFTKYTNQLRNSGAYSAENGEVLHLLLFPEEDMRRKFGMLEARLSVLLVKVLEERGVGGARVRSLKKWAGDLAVGTAGRAGCLGEELRRILQGYPEEEPTYKRTIHEINALLDELATHSKFTQLPDTEGIVPKKSQLAVLNDLYRTATPYEASLITQVILKDLRPIVSPLKVVHTTTNLLRKKPANLPLTVWQALKIWHSTLPGLYRVYASIPEVFNVLENGTGAQLDPILGIPIQIPKCHKGRSCKDAITTLASSKKLFCETKYDGERMQIHIDLTLPFEKQITIFSKSRRDSTLDRFATHEIIRAALGIPQSSITHPVLKMRVEEEELMMGFGNSIILEAEMVAFSEKSGLVDEFWRIRDLVAGTAKGVRRRLTSRTKSTEKKIHQHVDSSESSEESPAQASTGYSLESNGSDDGDRHFQLVFFDVLQVDGRGLLREPYATRRRLLQEVITVIRGFAVLVERTPIKMVGGDPCKALQNILSSSIAHFEEGLVIKAEESTYNSQALPWVKLKRDYIPGIYDCIDMAVIGASWDKVRARELEVGTDTFTTFYVAALSQQPQKLREKASFECLFTVSYGLSREQLERLNFEIKSNSPVPYHSKPIPSISYTFTLCPGLSPPSVLFRKPMLFELFGAGFDKPPRGKYYALRWPRVSKVHRTEERNWTAGETLESFSAKAYAAVGRDPSEKSTTIQVARMWSVSPQVSPKARSVVKMKAIEFDCLNRLRKSDPSDSLLAVSSQRFKRTRSGKPILTPNPIEEGAIDPSVTGLRLEQLPDPLELLKDLKDVEPSRDSGSDSSPRKRRGQVPRMKPPLEGVADLQEDRLQWDIVPVPAIFPRATSIVPPEVSLMAASCPLPAGSPPRTPPSSHLQIHVVPKNTGQGTAIITMGWLLTDSFILVHRPLWPRPPPRPRGRLALRQMLPGNRLVSTLDALLVGISWAPRKAPISQVTRRGVIFLDPANVQPVITELEGHSKMLKAGQGPHAKIFLVSKSYLDIYGDLDLNMAVDVLWESH